MKFFQTGENGIQRTLRRRMQGSKYDDETRERALAMCAMPKMNPAKVAAAMGIPRATVYDWQKTAQETDPDFVAVRRNKLRRMMDKAYSVISRSLNGLETQSKAIELEKAEVDHVILRILADPELDDDTRSTITEIVRDYTGTKMTDLVKVMRETMEVQERLERQLHPEAETSGVQIAFDDDIKELSE